MLAGRLKPSDEIRVIAPARSLSIVNEERCGAAITYLADKGYNVTFSRHCREVEYADSASVLSRVEDLHDAFTDKSVKAILTAIGGFNSNQLLEHIDYSLIKSNPKLLSGYSDITALLNAIYAKTGLVTYHGPHFSTFAFGNGREYTGEHFEKCVASFEPYDIAPSEQAGEYSALQEGCCEGTIIGGNLCTLNLLQGTDYMPLPGDAILFLEDDNIMGEFFAREFERNLQSLLQVRGIDVKGIVIGRFSDDCGMTTETEAQMLLSKQSLRNIPILTNVDFGHIFPFAAFPIGGKARITALKGGSEVTILEH